MILREEFLSYLDREIKSIEDFIVFLVTIEYIVLPTNQAINNVPSDDLAFCKITAENILTTLGCTHVGSVLSTWDTLGVHGCLDAERFEVVVGRFTRLRANLQTLTYARSEIEDNSILTLWIQKIASGIQYLK